MYYFDKEIKIYININYSKIKYYIINKNTFVWYKFLKL